MFEVSVQETKDNALVVFHDVKVSDHNHSTTTVYTAHACGNDRLPVWRAFHAYMWKRVWISQGLGGALYVFI